MASARQQQAAQAARAKEQLRNQYDGGAVARVAGIGGGGAVAAPSAGALGFALPGAKYARRDAAGRDAPHLGRVPPSRDAATDATNGGTAAGGEDEDEDEDVVEAMGVENAVEAVEDE